MTLAVTLMVRDEADVLPTWLAYHVAQGMDVLVVTDNGSVDGTREILEQFAAESPVVVDLRHDPVHRKQQSATVTRMARDAHTVHGADWVVNADADEFLVAKDRQLSLREVFTRLDPAVRAFVVPVVNMVGPLADHGVDLGQLVWRDERTDAELREVGLLSHPTGNSIHVGDPEVAVVQGNHLVTMAAGDAPAEELALEVLHFPWRSWRQYAHRVEIAGLAYESNPDAQPSPNHHGMRDYRRLRAGTLKGYYALRHVTAEEAAGGHFTADDVLVQYLAGHGIDALSDMGAPVPAAEAADLVHLGRGLVERDAEIERLAAEVGSLTENKALLENAVQHTQARALDLELLANQREEQVRAFKARKVVRLADQAGDRARVLRQRLGRS
ncbi:glycosyltransferase family 2 protein [Frigoribacterium sp. PhB116]|uniref:glycosyltransferase family 2 protein n=1 Tax=Frigoribacterium sp. PhB116 TaxID=2485174 RepID=UPI00105D7B52|nr:glycosyltransferase family 2 protein [Frigoribacterium sp. PhB116]TDT66069.1 glycosyl transferase family 2 [Frigoribacterium sp. PhB116]